MAATDKISTLLRALPGPLLPYSGPTNSPQSDANDNLVVSRDLFGRMTCSVGVLVNLRREGVSTPLTPERRAFLVAKYCTLGKPDYVTAHLWAAGEAYFLSGHAIIALTAAARQRRGTLSAETIALFDDLANVISTIEYEKLTAGGSPRAVLQLFVDESTVASRSVSLLTMK